MPFSKFAYRKSGETRISARSQGSALSNSILLSPPFFPFLPLAERSSFYRLRKHDVNLAAAVAAVLQVSTARAPLCRFAANGPRKNP